jgi:hypothetical protein
VAARGGEGHGVAGSGPTAALTGSAHVRGARPASKQGRDDADERPRHSNGRRI